MSIKNRNTSTRWLNNGTKLDANFTIKNWLKFGK